MLYSYETLSMFYDLQHVLPECANIESFTLTKENMTTENKVKFYMKIEQDQIKQCFFQAKGDVALLAACEWVCRYLSQQPASKILEITSGMLLEALNLPNIKMHTATFIIQALAT